MGPGTSKLNRPTPAKTMVAIVPRIPQEIIDEILSYLAADPDPRPLRSYALVSKSWALSCRRHLFHTVLFTSKDMARWVEMFPVPEESPAHNIRHLRFSIGGDVGALEEFLKHTPWFTNVEKVTFLGDEGLQPLWISLFLGVPQSVTSLTIGGGTAFLRQVRDTMTWLPNLENLSLSGDIIVVGKISAGTGTVLRGRFSGQLRLLEGYADDDIMNILLEVPTGLHFTEVQIHAPRERLLSTVRLAEACSRTLVKLSYRVSFYCEPHPFSRSSRSKGY